MGLFSFWGSDRPDDTYTTTGHPVPDPLDLPSEIYDPSPDWREFDPGDHEDDDDDYRPYSLF